MCLCSSLPLLNPCRSTQLLPDLPTVWKLCSQVPPCPHSRLYSKKKKKGFNYRRREPIRSLNLTWLFINQNTRCLRQRRIGGQLRSQPAAGASQQLLESSQDHEGQQRRSGRVNAGAAAQLSPRCPHIPGTMVHFWETPNDEATRPQSPPLGEILATRPWLCTGWPLQVQVQLPAPLQTPGLTAQEDFSRIRVSLNLYLCRGM